MTRKSSASASLHSGWPYPIGGSGQPAPSETERKPNHFVSATHPHTVSFGCRPRVTALLRVVFLLLFCNIVAYGYSVLSHEAIVDSLWDSPIKKMLVERFPDATPD